jgi:hypothetical protein
MLDRIRRRKRASLEGSIARPTIVITDTEIKTWAEKTAKRVYERASSDRDWDYVDHPSERSKIVYEYIEEEVEKIAQRLDEIGCFSVLVVQHNKFAPPETLTGDTPVSGFLELLFDEVKTRVEEMMGKDMEVPDFDDDDDDDDF